MSNRTDAPASAELVAAPTGSALFGTWLTFLLVSIAARPIGTLFPKIGLPLITGYLVVGAVAGPFALGLIHKQDLQPLSLVTQFALAFISFSAGAELYLPELRSLFKRILYSTTGIAVVTFISCTLLITAFASGSGIVPFMEQLPLGCRVSVASIAAAIMVARSPASAIAVVKEMRAKGTFTSSILGVTVLGDVFVLMLFTITTSIAESECKGEGFSITSLFITMGVIVLSIGIGYGLGHFLLLLMLFRRVPTRYLILPLGLAVFVTCHWFTDWTHENLAYVINLEPLLICIMAGYVCSNKSRHRHRFIGVLQQAGPLVFLPFFTLTGASLDMRVMVQSFGFAVLIASIRAICIFIGSSTGGYAAGERPYSAPSNMYSWMCLLTQAGVSLGLASEVGMSFPTWGRAFQTAIISVVLVNQIVGPILFKIAVRRMGEAGKAALDDGHDADSIVPTALIVGYSPTSTALAVRLLSDRWNVTMVCADNAGAEAARADVALYASEARKAASHARSATSQVVDGLKAGVKVLAEKAGDAAKTVAESVVGAVSGAKKLEEKSASGQGALEYEHEPMRLIENSFTSVALLAPGASSEENPLSYSFVFKSEDRAFSPDAAAGEGFAGTQTAQGLDYRYVKLVQLVSSTRSLAAVVLACPTDDVNYTAAKVIDTFIASAPKRSSLHAVRVLSFVHGLPWTHAFEALGVLPLHTQLHATHFAAKVLSAQRGKPVMVLPSTANQDELCKAVAGVLQGPHMWKFGEESSGGESIQVRVMEGRAASPGSPTPLLVSLPRTTSGQVTVSSPDEPRHLSKNLGSMRDAIVASLQSEDVGEWAGARDEYIDSLHAMGEGNEEHGSAAGGTPWDEHEDVSSGRQGRAIEDVAMFSFLGQEGDETEKVEGEPGDEGGLGKRNGPSGGAPPEDTIF